MTWTDLMDLICLFCSSKCSGLFTVSLVVPTYDQEGFCVFKPALALLGLATSMAFLDQ